MAIELPNLDDRTYDDLVQEALGMIPTDAPQWTNHNPSDPGITLIELFAYLTEMLLYRQNRVTEANKWMFLQLLNGPDWQPNQDLQTEIKEAITKVRDRYRAITCNDFVELALEADPTITRAHCIPRRNLNSENPLVEPVDQPGHVSIIIIPGGKQVVIFALLLLIQSSLYQLASLLIQYYLVNYGNHSNNSPPQPSSFLINQVKKHLEKRRLIGTAIHVVVPSYITISIRLTIYLNREAEVETSGEQINNALENFFDPLPNPDNPQGWQFGRNVYVSELYQLLDELEFVDYVTKTHQQDEVFLPDPDAIANEQRLVYTNAKELSAIQLKPEELVNLDIGNSDIDIISPIENVDFTE
ncbi:MAG: hypothetical protein F6K25_15970 [Okeania sp. SIO2G4]|uniref:baseplate J/gp47 family protein n=1 Tax=unclassified Okeania TaxID=2634635 RepID=UPI0013BBAF32|nr:MULTISPECIES: baseplate J/gp47 family protein [unclassified Okeania]NEP73690.1 hypothetical protein [Okeania sp. SIO2G5]NEP94490.1 hypothetical protein [Okeania sp. SIO2F5]NEQ92113.1 hypothetical protein [Okeania sp. SIO2G4]